jgi:hypothetical protein
MLLYRLRFMHGPHPRMILMNIYDRAMVHWVSAIVHVVVVVFMSTVYNLTKPKYITSGMAIIRNLAIYHCSCHCAVSNCNNSKCTLW